jgi:hypothetical protein
MNINIILFLVILFLFLLLFSINYRTNEFFKSNYKLKFVHIPKTAGTSIENIALKHNIKWGANEWGKKDYNEKLIKEHNNCFTLDKPWIHLKSNYTSDNNKCSPWHIPPSKLGRNIYNENDKLFCVVRNPYNKIVSEYKKHRSKNISKNELNKFVKNYINNTNIYNNLFNCHLIPQHEYTHGYIKCDHILKYENLHDEFKELMEKYNLGHIKLDKNDNKSSNKLNRNDLTLESKDIIYNFYKKDFQLFNYPK